MLSKQTEVVLRDKKSSNSTLMCEVDVEKGGAKSIFPFIQTPVSSLMTEHTIKYRAWCSRAVHKPLNITNITRWAENLPDLWTSQAKPPTNLPMPSYPGSLLLLLGRHSSSWTPQLMQDSEIPGRIPEQMPRP